MSWARFDDVAGDNPKLISVTIEARWLWFRSVLYAGRHLTDGILQRGALVPIAGDLYERGDVQDFAQELLERTLWHDELTAQECPSPWCLEAPAPDERQWSIHDFLEFNPSKAKVQSDRADRSRRGKLGAHRRWGLSAPVDNAVENDADGNSDGASQGPGYSSGQSSGHSNSQDDGDSQGRGHATGHGRSNAPSRPQDQDPGYSSTSSSSVVPDPSAEPPTSNADDLPDELDPTSAHLVRQIRKRAPAFAEQVHGSQLARLQAERGPTIVREAMIALSAMEAPTTVRAWPAYLDEVVDRAAADVARWEAEKQRLRKPEPTEQGGGSDANGADQVD